MQNGIYIPKINPIQFYPLDTVFECCYTQKYFITDKTHLQFVSINTTFSVTLQIYTSNNELITTLQPAINIVNGNDNYTFYTFYVDFSTLQLGAYYFKANFKNLIDQRCSYITSCIDITEADKLEDQTVLLEYKNSENDFDIYFAGYQFALRCEGGFYMKNYNPKSTDSIYQSQTNDFVLLKSSPYSTQNINIGGIRGIPDWLHEIVNRAFSCNSLLINGISYTKYMEATWQPTEADGVPFRSWIIEVVKTGDNVSEIIDCIDSTIFNSVLTWTGDPICQISGGNNTGKAIYPTLINEIFTPFGGSIPFKTNTYSLLSAFGSYPAITSAQLASMTTTAINNRANALINFIPKGSFTVSNTVTVTNTTLCPAPPYIKVLNDLDNIIVGLNFLGCESYSKTIFIESNYDWGIVETIPSWLTLSQTTGQSGLTELTVTANNYTNITQTFNLSFKLNDYDLQTSLTINQSACTDSTNFIQATFNNNIVNISSEYKVKSNINIIVRVTYNDLNNVYHDEEFSTGINLGDKLTPLILPNVSIIYTANIISVSPQSDTYFNYTY